MNVDKINNWLTLLANFGVIAGVIFLAFEIHQNNQLLVQESRYSMLQNQKDWKMFINGNPEISKLIYTSPTEQLNELDRVRRFEILSGVLLTWQWEWEQSQSGLLGASRLPIVGFRAVWKIQNIQSDWVSLKPSLKPSFADFLESKIAN
jgi:hypothetical protein